MRLSVPRKQPLAEAAAKESQGGHGSIPGWQPDSTTPSAWFWLWGCERCKNEGLGHGFFPHAFREPLRPGSG